MNKLRIIKLIVLPVAVVDDGENLKEIEIDQMVVPSDSIDEFVDNGLRKALQSLQDKIESEI
jgi:hypothetical protein